MKERIIQIFNKISNFAVCLKQNLKHKLSMDIPQAEIMKEIAGYLRLFE